MRIPFYTGSYAGRNEDGICRFVLDTEQETLQKTHAWQGFVNPSFVIRNAEGTSLFAVEEKCPEGAVLSLRLAGDELVTLDRQSSFGADPCHLCLWPGEDTLVAANYTDGSYAVYRVSADGSLQKTQGEKKTGGGPNAVRQECAHMHFSIFRNGKVYMTDLGTDLIYRWQADEVNSQLAKPEERISLPSGCGPRHLAFGEDGMMYVLCELTSQICVYRPDDTGYQLIQIVDTVADKACKNIAAAIRCQNGRVLISNRGEDTIVLYRIEEDGTLSLLHRCACGGRVPRDFAVLDSFIVVCNQESSMLTVLKLNDAQTEMELTDIRFSLPRPTCICL